MGCYHGLPLGCGFWPAQPARRIPVRSFVEASGIRIEMEGSRSIHPVPNQIKQADVVLITADRQLVKRRGAPCAEELTHKLLDAPAREQPLNLGSCILIYLLPIDVNRHCQDLRRGLRTPCRWSIQECVREKLAAINFKF